MQLTSEITVRLIQSVGGDHMMVAAAKVSTNGTDAMSFADGTAKNDKGEPWTEKDTAGLIRYLMKHRHGTPFEHSSLTFFVHAPIFVWREWHRHRIGQSYNEESARYKQLAPTFYIPPRNRPMIKVESWKPGRPKFLTLDEHVRAEHQLTGTNIEERYQAIADTLYDTIIRDMSGGYEDEYARYERQLDRKLDPGLARDNLPVGIYSSCWVTCNPRSLMAFLSLRTHEPEAKFPSYPLYEIEEAARACEAIFATGWPITYAAFQECGRVAP